MGGIEWSILPVEYGKMSSMNNFREKNLHWSLFVNWSFWGWRSQGGGNCIKWIRFNLDRIIWIRCDQLKKKLPSLWRWGEENPPWALQDSNDNYLRAKANINSCRTMALSYFCLYSFLVMSPLAPIQIFQEEKSWLARGFEPATFRPASSYLAASVCLPYVTFTIFWLI